MIYFIHILKWGVMAEVPQINSEIVLFFLEMLYERIQK